GPGGPTGGAMAMPSRITVAPVIGSALATPRIPSVPNKLRPLVIRTLVPRSLGDQGGGFAGAALTGTTLTRSGEIRLPTPGGMPSIVTSASPARASAGVSLTYGTSLS